VVELLDRKLIFVTGKGGVGKTTIAAALALLAADRGKRTLLCEMDAKGDLASTFETSPTRFHEREIAPNLWAMSMDTEASLRQYLSMQLRFGRAAYIGPLAKMFDFVASAAPGVREIVSVGKLCWEVRERHYDIVVVDAVASGHIIGQLAAPQAINRLVQVGLIRQQTDWMIDILSDPKTSGALAVTTPEEMPVSETIELVRRLEAETTVGLAGVVVNRVLPELFGAREEKVFEALSEPAASEQLAAALDGPVGPLLDAARLMVKMRRSRAAHLDRLREVVGTRASGDKTPPEKSVRARRPKNQDYQRERSFGRASGDSPVPAEVFYVPFLFLRSYGLRSTRQVASALAAELDL
jgi:anion-transporting  ArsA/GET3 family ATPase